MAQVGRPTKWTEDMPARVEAYYKMCLEDTEQVPLVSELATLLDITRETLDEWVNDETKPDEFSYTIGKLKNLQQTRLIKKGLDKKGTPAMEMFLLKSNHGMRETQNVDITSKDKELNAGIFVGDFKNDN